MSHHRAGLFAFRTFSVFDARAVFIAFSAALILASRLTSGAGKFKAKFSRASARFKRSAFLVSEIGWPIKLSYRKTTPSDAALGSPDNPSNTDAFNPRCLALGVLHHRLIQGQFCRIAASKPLIFVSKNASENRSVGGSSEPLVHSLKCVHFSLVVREQRLQLTASAAPLTLINWSQTNS